jgi:hypothetical protein
MHCNHCDRDVLSIDGTCPGCGRTLSDQAPAAPGSLHRDLLAIAIDARAKGASYGEIGTHLTNAGVDEEVKRQIMAEVEGRTPAGQERQNRSEMRHGLVWLIGGIAVTGITYLMAANSREGGGYVIAWGAMLVGGLRFLVAVIRTISSPRR